MFCHANLISRSAGAKRFIWGNCLYKHLVPPGPKTAPGNNSATCCGNFRDRTLAIGITSFNNFLRHISSEVWVDIVPHVVPLVRRAQKIGGTPQCLMVVSCTSRPGLLQAVVWSKL